MIQLIPGNYIVLSTQMDAYIPIWCQVEALSDPYAALQDYTCYFWDVDSSGLFIGFDSDKKIGYFSVTDNNGGVRFGYQHIDLVIRVIDFVFLGRYILGSHNTITSHSTVTR